MPLRYVSGEEILVGDHVLYAGEPGVIEIVADPENPTSETDWYIQEFGRGVMIGDLKSLGRLYTKPDDRLQFARRAESAI